MLELSYYFISSLLLFPRTVRQAQTDTALLIWEVQRRLEYNQVVTASLAAIFQYFSQLFQVRERSHSHMLVLHQARGYLKGLKFLKGGLKLFTRKAVLASPPKNHSSLHLHSL